MPNPTRGRAPHRPHVFVLARSVVVLALLGVSGCGGGAARSGRGPEIAANNPLPGSISSCVRPRRASVEALTFDGRVLPFAAATGHEPRCPRGTLRITTLQALVVDGRITYVRRGGCERPVHRSPCTLQPTAHVLASDLAPIRPEPGKRNGNGNAVRNCARTLLDDPRSVGRALDRMYYKRPDELRGRRRDAAGARWSNYGDPGRRFGSTDYNYLLWNLPRSGSGVLPGGGIVEAVLAQGQLIQLCDDAALSLPSFDARGKRNGLVLFDYGRVSNAGQAIYGWFLRAYEFRHDTLRQTAQALAGGTPVSANRARRTPRRPALP